MVTIDLVCYIGACVLLVLAGIPAQSRYRLEYFAAALLVFSWIV